MTRFDPSWPDPPPADPVDLRDWLLAQEERLARITRQRVREAVEQGYEAFLSTLTASGDPSALDAILQVWQTSVEGELVDLYTGIYRAGAISAWVQSPGTAALGGEALEGWTQVVNQDALDYQQAATNRLAGVGDTVWSDVRAKTVLGIEQGMTNEELKDLIRGDGELVRFSEQRADTIARTETNAAYNGGNYDAAQALGEYGPVAKEWLSAVDRRTRPTHLEANGQAVAFDQPFSVGGISMMRPHDPSAPAGEVVNCRCSLLMLYDGDADSSGRVWRDERPRASVAPAPSAARPASLLDEAAEDDWKTGTFDPIPGRDGFAEGLPEAEAEALRRYTGSGFEDLNYNLRVATSRGDLTELSAADLEQIELLDSAIARAGEGEPFLAYRGMTLPEPIVPPGSGPYSFLPPEEQLALLRASIDERYVVGETVDFGGSYVSTARDVAAPLDASVARTPRGVLFEIEATRGAPLSGVTRFADEYEVLLPRDSRFEVVRVTHDVEVYDAQHDRTYRRSVVQLRQLDPPRAAIPEPSAEVDPRRLSAAEAKRERRRRQGAASRDQNRQTMETAQAAAERFGVSVDEVIAARSEVMPTRRAIKEAAYRAQVDILAELDQGGSAYLRDRLGSSAAFDAVERLSPAARSRYRRWLRSSRLDSIEADDALEQMQQAGLLPQDWNPDQFVEWHIEQTERYDALAALRVGRLPSERIYGSLDPDALLELDGLKVSRIVGVHPDDAAAYLASIDRDRYADYAYRALEPSMATDYGPEPWRMSFLSWEEEVLDLSYGLRTYPTEMPEWAATRLRQLIPYEFDLDASLEDIYAAIVSTARIAGLEVPEYAVIPWA